MSQIIERNIFKFRFQTPRNENEERLIDSWVDQAEQPEKQLSNLLEEEDETNNAIEDNPDDEHSRPKDRIVLDSSKESLLLLNNTNTSQEVAEAMETGPSDGTSSGDLQSQAQVEIESTEPVEPVPDPLSVAEDATESEDDASTKTSSKTIDPSPASTRNWATDKI